MIITDEYSHRLGETQSEIDDLIKALNIESVKKELEELEAKTAEPGFWNDPASSRPVVERQNALKGRLADAAALTEARDDVETLIEIANESGDEAMASEIEEALDKLEAIIEKQRLATLLTGEYDSKNAILTFHAGAGGTEAQDWVEMLYRMYSRFAQAHGFKVTVLDYLDGEEAGIKSASILIEGPGAYGYLKSENGVHRLVRVSPFDSSGRRHTSFASLEVMPDIGDDTAVEIREDDIKMDVFRSSGAGGQHVNKTSSAVRLTHIPTGLVVSCQNERSQFQNREMCMKMLKAKLIQIKEREHLEKIEDIKGVQMDIAWGSQIRSYVFMPYTLVKDHRTGYEMGNVQAVMDGDLDGFINAYLIYKSRESNS
ncbi:MAG: peptide chain release factor 2 [Oscillospiraceae bacterium]|nr:peptide chain release factor 2 [Oscillospiraceae bacterium]